MLARLHSVGWILLASLLAATIGLGAPSERRVLVYTRNQIGPKLYVHDNIAASVEAIRKLAQENNFIVEVSTNPAVFSEANLKQYKALVFDNVNNEILENEGQKTALQTYIRGGGGFVGIHSATGAMRDWPWYWALIGGKFDRHAKMQKFSVKVIDPQDASTVHLPATFEWTDEFYYVDHIPPGRHVLLAGDLTSLDDPGKEKSAGKSFGDNYPLAWRHEFEGGRAWYTALGHQKEHYSDPRFAQHLLGGILWAMGEEKRAHDKAVN